MTENVDLHVAGYHLTELIGSGGMGEVYKAVVASEGKTLPVGSVVAVKLLHTHLQRISEFQKRFHREANLAAKIDHPNVVRVIEAGIDYRYHYIVMEYVEGLKLTDLMQDKQPLSPQQTIEVMSQICEALHAASHIIDDYSLDVDADDLPAVSNIPVRIRSLVHRDIKPDNILIQPRDPREYEQMSQTGDKKALANIHVKLLDFGLAKDFKAISTILSMAGQSLGTPAYMSPEQCQGDIVDQRTDIYSLGICAYQMITGTTPFPGPTTVAYAKQHAEEIPPDILTRNPLCPKNLADCIMRCLAKDAKDRYQTPETLKEDLQRVAQGKSVCKIHKFKKPRSISKRKISAIVLTTIVVVLLAMGGLWYYMTDRAKSSLQESIRQADLAVAAEKYAEAEEILNQAISDFPDRPDKEQLTAMAQLRLRDISVQAAKQRNALAKARAEKEERRRKAAEEQVKRQHEQAAGKAITEIQAHIAQGEFQKAIDAANQAVKQYADTDSGKKIPELLAEATTKLKGRQEAERAKVEAEGKRLEAENIARHDRFVEYRDQGRSAMQNRDYYAARIAFENALKEEDDEDTRKQYDLAVDRTTRHRIAVVDFSEKGDVGIQDAGRVVAELLVSKFSLDRYELIERSQLAKLLEEVDLSISLVRDDPEKAYDKLKYIKDVRFLIIGSVVKLGDLTATARMVDVQTGVIRQTAEVSAKDAQSLKDALKELANILQMTPEEKRDYLDESVYPKLLNDAREKARNKHFDEALEAYRRVLAIRSSQEVQQELSLVENGKAAWIKQQESEKEDDKNYTILFDEARKVLNSLPTNHATKNDFTFTNSQTTLTTNTNVLADYSHLESTPSKPPVGHWKLKEPVSDKEYFIYVPRRYKHDRPTPVIFLCPGEWISPQDMLCGKGAIKVDWRSYGERYGYIIVAFDKNVPSMSSWLAKHDSYIEQEKTFLSILSTLSFTHNIDRANICMAGFSKGGEFALWAGLRNPDIIRSVALEGCTFKSAFIDDTFPEESKSMPIFVLNGEKDSNDIKIQSEECVKYLKEKGFRPTVKVLPGQGNVSQPRYVMNFFLSHRAVPRGTMTPLPPPPARMPSQDPQPAPATPAQTVPTRHDYISPPPP